MRGSCWRLWGAALLALAGGCIPVSDPAKGIYACLTGADCGEGFECRARADGGAGRCFAAGACSEVELCNGRDDDCDGLVDESFPEQGTACLTGRDGGCGRGQLECRLGQTACRQTVQPAAEACNGQDDDCDGLVDEDFSLASDSRHCGACGVTCGQGTSCAEGTCVEAACADAVDNDRNGFTDCQDPRCFQAECTTLQLPPSRCGQRPALPDAGPGDAGSSDGGPSDGGPLDAGPSDAGPGAGTLERGCYAPEMDCENGFDDDGDGAADCADLDCDARTCAPARACANRQCPGPG